MKSLYGSLVRIKSAYGFYLEHLNRYGLLLEETIENDQKFLYIIKPLSFLRSENKIFLYRKEFEII